MSQGSAVTNLKPAGRWHSDLFPTVHIRMEQWFM